MPLVGAGPTPGLDGSGRAPYVAGMPADTTEMHKIDRLLVQTVARVEALTKDVDELKAIVDRIDLIQQEVKTQVATQSARSEADVRRIEALEHAVRRLQESTDSLKRRSQKSTLAYAGGAAVGGGTLVSVIQQLLEILGTGQ